MRGIIRSTSNSGRAITDRKGAKKLMGIDKISSRQMLDWKQDTRTGKNADMLWAENEYDDVCASRISEAREGVFSHDAVEIPMLWRATYEKVSANMAWKNNSVELPKRRPRRLAESLSQARPAE